MTETYTDEMMDRNSLLKSLNIELDNIDYLVSSGMITRRELTDIVLRRHILSMKEVLKYADKNIQQSKIKKKKKFSK